MKVRNDYVSNSSSSSYIVALRKEDSLDDFIEDVVKGCTTSRVEYDEDDNEIVVELEPDEKKYIEHLNKCNRRNLDYCLNTYEQLFLGSMYVGWKTVNIDGKKDCDNYRRRVDKCNWKFGEEEGVKLISNEDEKIVVEEKVGVCNVVVPKNRMEWAFYRGSYYESDEYHKKDEIDKIRLDAIMKFCKENQSYLEEFGHIELYEITMNTIKNTKQMLDAGLKVDVDKSQMDDFEKRLNEGQRLFSITMNQGGGGMDWHSIYATDGWDSDFNKFANAEIVCCECG